jgi:alcohol dehydrogenase class IV
MTTFQTPRTVVFGTGCFEEIGKYAAPLGRKCLIVTGAKAMIEHGFIGQAVELLEQEGVESVVCTGVEHDPSVETVDQIRQLFREKECDFVCAIGGGSSIDAAKAAAAFSSSPEPARDFFHGKNIPGSTVPIIAVPSTFGTGTEATRIAVLSDPAAKMKKGLRHDCMLPTVALVDPLLGQSAPPRLTAACGLDALTQAIESYLSINASDLSQAMSFNAAILLADGLPKVYADATDLDARKNCANGSLMAGIALHNANLGLVHGMAHPLGIRYGIAHGEICGILLPHVLRFNREAAGERYELLSTIFGQDAADFCENLLRKFGLPVDLRGFDIPEADFEKIAEDTLPSGSTAANPRPVEAKDVVLLLRNLCGSGEA